MMPMKNASSDMNSAERPMKQTTRLSALAIGLRLITTAAPKTSITKVKSQKRMGDIYRFRISDFRFRIGGAGSEWNQRGVMTFFAIGYSTGQQPIVSQNALLKWLRLA